MIPCPFCHTQIDPVAYFCPNCGKKVREKPVGTGAGDQVKLYLISVLLPPFGLGLTWRYVKSPDEKTKVIGIVSLILTFASLIFITWWSVSLINTINTQVNETMKQYQLM